MGWQAPVGALSRLPGRLFLGGITTTLSTALKAISKLVSIISVKAKKNALKPGLIRYNAV